MALAVASCERTQSVAPPPETAFAALDATADQFDDLTCTNYADRSEIAAQIAAAMQRYLEQWSDSQAATGIRAGTVVDPACSTIAGARSMISRSRSVAFR